MFHLASERTALEQLINCGQLLGEGQSHMREEQLVQDFKISRNLVICSNRRRHYMSLSDSDDSVCVASAVSDFRILERSESPLKVLSSWPTVAGGVPKNRQTVGFCGKREQ